MNTRPSVCDNYADVFLKVWNRRTNTAWAALTLAGHSGTVRCLHLHGNRLVSGSSDRTIKVQYIMNYDDTTNSPTNFLLSIIQSYFMLIFFFFSGIYSYMYMYVINPRCMHSMLIKLFCVSMCSTQYIRKA